MYRFFDSSARDLVYKALDEGWENYSEAAASAGPDAAKKMEEKSRAMIDRVKQGFTITEKEGNLDKSCEAARDEIKRILDHLSTCAPTLLSTSTTENPVLKRNSLTSNNSSPRTALLLVGSGILRPVIRHPGSRPCRPA